MPYLVTDYVETGLAIGSNNGRLIGVSPQITALRSKLELIADFPTSVLVTGETGTGKEVVAKALHYNSSRRHAPFVMVNCAAIPRDLLESELFGHKKGAFTGATGDRIGKFEAAHTGTLFLDEIGDMSPDLQAKILRVLEERKVTRVGSTVVTDVDVRIVSATNHDLETCIKDGRFREDLFYRLNNLVIELAPLRGRKEDILPLILYFIQQYNHRYSNQGVDLQGISEGALEMLENYSWPGNVRELRSMVEQCAIEKRKGIIGEDDVPNKLKTRIKLSHVVAELPKWYERGIKPYLFRDLSQDGRFIHDRSNLRRTVDAHPHHFINETLDYSSRGVRIIYLTPLNFDLLLREYEDEAELYQTRVKLHHEIVTDSFNQILSEPFAIYCAGDLAEKYSISIDDVRREVLEAKGVYVISGERKGNDNYRTLQFTCFVLRLQDLQGVIPSNFPRRDEVIADLKREILTRYRVFKEGN